MCAPSHPNRPPLRPRLRPRRTSSQHRRTDPQQHQDPMPARHNSPLCPATRTPARVGQGGRGVKKGTAEAHTPATTIFCNCTQEKHPSNFLHPPLPKQCPSIANARRAGAVGGTRLAAPGWGRASAAQAGGGWAFDTMPMTLWRGKRPGAFQGRFGLLGSA